MFCDFRRTFRPTPEEKKKDIEFLQRLWDENKKKRGCLTCANSKHIRNYPGFVLGEEYECIVGLECDTILDSVRNCEQYVEGTWEETEDLT